MGYTNKHDFNFNCPVFQIFAQRIYDGIQQN